MDIDLELVIWVLLVALVAAGLILAAVYTVRTRGASPQLAAGQLRGAFSHVLAVFMWILFLGISAALVWGDGTNPISNLHPVSLGAIALVAIFFAVPVWRSVDRFQGKPWSRRMSLDFAVSALTLIFSGWGLIQLASEDTESLAWRFMLSAVAVVLFAVLAPAAARWLGNLRPR